MKKLFALLLALSLLLTLAACGGGEQVANMDDNKETTANTTDATADTTDATQDSTESTEVTTEATTPESTTPPTTEPQPTETTPPETQPTHKHSYSSKVTKAASCTADGVKTYTCSCGKTYTESIKATGHSYSAKTTKEPTCTTEGVKTYTCKCGSTYTESIAAAGHAWGEWTTFKPATTTEKGESRRKCKNCTEFESKEIPVKPIQEHNVDTSINLTETAYEAAVRQYTNDYNYTQYYEGEFSNRFVFEMNGSNCGNTNVLSLTDLRAYIYVKRNPGQLGTLYSSEHQGYISYSNLSGADAVRQVLTNASAAFGPQKGIIEVEDFDAGWTNYTSVSEIPEETLQKVADGDAMVHVNYGISSSFTFNVCGTSGRLSVRYYIYYSGQDGI